MDKRLNLYIVETPRCNAYVVSTDPSSAYLAYRKILDKHDWGFTADRELESVRVVATQEDIGRKYLLIDEQVKG